jgi:hypothetical protein
MFDSSPAFLHGLCFWLPVPIRLPVGPGCRRGLSVLARVVSRRAHGSRTTPGLTRTRDDVPSSVAFPIGAHGRRPICVFRSSIPGPSMPLSMLHPVPHGTQRKTRGQDGSLLLSCGALSSPTTRRFIPTIALPNGRGSDSKSRSINDVIRAPTVSTYEVEFSPKMAGYFSPCAFRAMFMRFRSISAWATNYFRLRPFWFRLRRVREGLLRSREVVSRQKLAMLFRRLGAETVALRAA